MVKLTCPLPNMAQYINYLGFQVSKESNLNPKSLTELDSGMIVSSISCFN